MLAINGYDSKVAGELRTIVAREEVDEEVIGFRPPQIPEAERYVFCAGHLHGGSILERDFYDTDLASDVNFRNVVWVTERIFQKNPWARVCVVGSESGITGSFDWFYAGSKAAIHNYVENRKVSEHQQLVCVAPWIIEDSGMTIRRTDHEVLARHRLEHPKKRFLLSSEVATMIHYLLYIDPGYINNIVIRMNGGRHAR